MTARLPQPNKVTFARRPALGYGAPVEALFEQLIIELERPRALGAQTVRCLTDHFGLGREEVGRFLEEQLPRLDEFEIDLLLSSLFTPKLADQAVFAGILVQQALPAANWPALIARLAARPTSGGLIDAGGVAHRFNLQTVTLERYVHRLRLDGSVDAGIAGLIAAEFSPGQHPTLLAIARRAIWNTESRRETLRRVLNSDGTTECRLADAIELLKLMETSEASGIPDLLARIPAWEEVLRGQISGASQPKTFFNEQVRYMHGGGRDQRPSGDPALAAKQAELEFLGRLRLSLAQ